MVGTRRATGTASVEGNGRILVATEWAKTYAMLKEGLAGNDAPSVRKTTVEAILNDSTSASKDMIRTVACMMVNEQGSDVSEHASTILTRVFAKGSGAARRNFLEVLSEITSGNVGATFKSNIDDLVGEAQKDLTRAISSEIVAHYLRT